MTSVLNTPPTDPGDFGLEFNYAVWTAGTNIMLCNVPWNSDYRDIVNFTSQNDLDNYLRGGPGGTVDTTTRIEIPSVTYARAGKPVRINVPFNRAYKYNYVRVFNPSQPITGTDEPRTFYYFINDVRYIAPNTTELDIQLDVWQTFKWYVTFGNCYVERGHIGIANSLREWDFGRGYLTIPEGLDIGGEYVIQGSYGHTLVDVNTTPYGVLVCSTVSLTSSPGDVTSPNLNTAQASDFEKLPNGAGIYYFENLAAYKTFMEWVSDFPWVSQGIISITIVPAMSIEYMGHYDYGPGTLHFVQGNRIPDETITLVSDFRTGHMPLPSRYAHLTKFRTYPYSIIQLTTWSGNPIVLKPESIANNHIKVMQKVHYAPPSPRVTFIPIGYNAGAGVGDNVVSGEFLDLTTGIFDLPQFSLVNNSYIAFMASNRNALHYQYANADWSQQKALKGADTAYNQSTNDVQTGFDVNRIGTRRMGAQADLDTNLAARHAIGSVTGAVGSGLAGGSVGGPAGMAAGAAVGGAGAALNAGMSYATAAYGIRENTAMNISQSLQTQGANASNQMFKRDSNLGYAQYAAQGDYANAIAGIQAKVQDAKMLQPSVSGQVGGDAFNLTTHKWEIVVRVKMLQAGAMRSIGEYWLRYGYAINTFVQMPATLMCMEKFTYWKLKETYLRSSTCPELFRMTIRGIFEKGVTVWANPNDMGVIDLGDNDPLDGITY